MLWRYTITYAADILAGYQFLGACTSRVRLPAKSMDSNSRVNNTLFVYSGSKDTLQLWAHGEAPLVSGINVQVPKFVGWIYSPRSPPLSSTSSKTRTGNILFLHPSIVANREARTPCKHKYTGDTILHPRKEFQIPIHSRAYWIRTSSTRPDDGQAFQTMHSIVHMIDSRRSTSTIRARKGLWNVL